MNKQKPPYYICRMHIVDYQNKYYFIDVFLDNMQTQIKYKPLQKDLIIEENNDLDKILTENRYQVQKILNNKRPDTFYIDFKLKFILRDNFTAVNFNDLSKIVVLDRRNNQYLTYTHEDKDKKIFRIYTDGCYLEKSRRAAYAFIGKNLSGNLDLFAQNIYTQSSSLTELIAVVNALKHYRDLNKLRIVTDSRYIIKGLTEWIFNWKLNDWHTAQGEKVKNQAYWLAFDELSQGKYIEFEWVKAHRQHLENTLCDFYAKMKAKEGHFKYFDDEIEPWWKQLPDFHEYKKSKDKTKK